MALHCVWNMEDYSQVVSISCLMERPVENQLFKVVKSVQSMMDLEGLTVDVRRSCRMERSVVKANLAKALHCVWNMEGVNLKDQRNQQKEKMKILQKHPRDDARSNKE